MLTCTQLFDADLISELNNCCTFSYSPIFPPQYCNFSTSTWSKVDTPFHCNSLDGTHSCRIICNDIRLYWLIKVI